MNFFLDKTMCTEMEFDSSYLLLYTIPTRTFLQFEYTFFSLPYTIPKTKLNFETGSGVIPSKLYPMYSYNFNAEDPLYLNSLLNLSRERERKIVSLMYRLLCARLPTTYDPTKIIYHPLTPRDNCFWFPLRILWCFAHIAVSYDYNDNNWYLTP